MSEHTPTPWRVHAYHTILSSHDDEVIHWRGFHGSDVTEAEDTANATFIVRAVNAHDDLVAVLTELREAMNGMVGFDSVVARIDDVLAKAGVS